MNEYNQVTLPNYSYVFNFESDFIHTNTRTWMEGKWNVVFYAVGVYMAFIVLGQYIMQNRPKFQLRGILCFWNTALAIFSTIGACRMVPELFHILTHHGLYHSICIPSFIEQNRVSGFWTWLFVLSKIPELGDTVFIILRKQPLIFLHWYHHITVLLYSWFSYTEYTSSARWFIAINYCVHSCMYSYYALRAAGYAPPKQIAMVVTLLQLVQMVVGCFISFRTHQILEKNIQCQVTSLNVKLSISMYFSYFVLFARFFYKSYIDKDRKKWNASTHSSSTDYSIMKAKVQ